MIRLRNTDEWVGLLVVAALVLFIGAVLEAGLLRDWFRPSVVLRILLPATGVNGLAAGADIEVLGIHAGSVRRIVIQPDQQMYAEATIDDQAKAFIRRDSQATIRRRFGVAGSAFVDISRGTGAQMDWRFAVVDATTEQGPADSIGALIVSLREKVFPILDEAHDTIAALRTISERIEKGQGTVGRLVSDDALAQKLDKAVTSLQQQLEKVDQATDALNAITKDVHSVTSSMAADDGVPALLRRLNALLTTLQSSTRDIAQATPRLPQISRNVETASADLPALLTQTQLTLAELEKVLAQLEKSWLLGGGGAPPPESRRAPVTEIKP
ncbi:MAG TPA: MlaD family protein [Stellaceae bacterium]|nr:MlaD family protein [Stellaceae bacterium]